MQCCRNDRVGDNMCQPPGHFRDHRSRQQCFLVHTCIDHQTNFPQLLKNLTILFQGNSNWSFLHLLVDFYQPMISQHSYHSQKSCRSAAIASLKQFQCKLLQTATKLSTTWQNGNSKTIWGIAVKGEQIYSKVLIRWKRGDRISLIATVGHPPA